jgi:ATP:corrinoid adenosyltransferase
MNSWLIEDQQLGDYNSIISQYVGNGNVILFDDQYRLIMCGADEIYHGIYLELIDYNDVIDFIKENDPFETLELIFSIRRAKKKFLGGD